MSKNDNDIFMIPVTHCKRCGRLLTSTENVKAGFGHVCFQKATNEEKSKQPLHGQTDLFDFQIDMDMAEE